MKKVQQTNELLFVEKIKFLIIQFVQTNISLKKPN